jgi:N-acetyl-gamma-glutamylphosphate reductase
MERGMTAAVPAKLPRSVEFLQVESVHSQTYAQSPTVPWAGPSVTNSEKVMATLDAFAGAIIQTQNQEFP